LQDVPDTFSSLKPFIPAGTLGDPEKSHAYCLPDFLNGPYPLQVFRTLNRASPCLRNQFCASSPGADIPAQTQAFGGCYCDSDCAGNGDCCVDAVNCYFRQGASYIRGSELFTESDCVGGLLDCNGRCFGDWAFTVVGDGICDNGIRTIDLNCASGRFEFMFDNGDCGCPSGQFIGCSGTCEDSRRKGSCTCESLGPAVATRDCTNICAPLVPKIFCSGTTDFDLDCATVYSLVPGATSLTEATSRVCSVLPPGCTVPIPAFVGDHVCDLDPVYNTQLCAYDGGDCCPASCLTFAHTAEEVARCGSAGYNCLDPNP